MKAFGKLCELITKGDLLITTQAVFEQTRDHVTDTESDTAEQHQQFTVFFVHGSTVQTRTLLSRSQPRGVLKPMIMEIRKDDLRPGHVGAARASKGSSIEALAGGLQPGEPIALRAGLVRIRRLVGES